jgi:hypothetical protein
VQNNNYIATALKRHFWVLMAVLCIVFSSASKRLIEMKMAPYYTVYQALGKKIKDGCRDKRDSFKFFKQADSKRADTNNPEFLFFLSALAAFVIMLSSGRFFYQKSFTGHSFIVTGSLPLFLRTHRLQV